MSRTIHHDTFSIERTYDATPARVFQAWQNPELKALWFRGDDSWKVLERSMDFRVGGHDRLYGKFANGTESDFNAHYHDIVDNQRIVYAYDMKVDGKRISVSVASIEIEKLGDKTRLCVTEQGAYFDGPEGAASRERGSIALIDRIAATLVR
jgi:uncharacterized protein YndB with AHSA1/START domain